MFEYVNVNTVLCNLSLKRCRCKKDAYIIVAKWFNKQLKPILKMIDTFLEKWETLYAFKEILLKYKEIGPINPSTS